MTLPRILFVPDTHAPYHDKRAWKLMIKVANEIEPRDIVILGDFIDMYSVSAHSKDPKRANQLKEEIRVANGCLDDLQLVGADNYYYVRGNHEDRLDRFINDKAPELDGLVNLDEWLKLGKRGYKVTPYKETLRIGKLNITHDVGNAGAMAHVQAQQCFEGNVVIGHIHRMGVTYAGNAQGKSHVGACFGWMGDRNAVDYMHKAKVNRLWQLGFGIGSIEPNGTVHLQAIPIVEYKCVVDGKLYNV